MSVYSRAPKVGDLVTYFKATTGKRVPAQIVSLVGTVATLRLASNTTVTGIAKMTVRTGYNTWSYVRRKT